MTRAVVSKGSQIWVGLGKAPDLDGVVHVQQVAWSHAKALQVLLRGEHEAQPLPRVARHRVVRGAQQDQRDAQAPAQQSTGRFQ